MNTLWLQGSTGSAAILGDDAEENRRVIVLVNYGRSRGRRTNKTRISC